MQCPATNPVAPVTSGGCGRTGAEPVAAAGRRPRGRRTSKACTSGIPWSAECLYAPSSLSRASLTAAASSPRCRRSWCRSRVEPHPFWDKDLDLLLRVLGNGVKRRRAKLGVVGRGGFDCLIGEWRAASCWLSSALQRALAPISMRLARSPTPGHGTPSRTGIVFNLTHSGAYDSLSFRRQGGTLLVADRRYPSSRTRPGCGTAKTKLGLSERTCRCDACGLVTGRDANAARNLLSLAASGADRVTACGGTVRPGHAGHVPVKQEPGTRQRDQTGTVPRQHGTAA
jgi:hypothetical protein